MMKGSHMSLPFRSLKSLLEATSSLVNDPSEQNAIAFTTSLNSIKDYESRILANEPLIAKITEGLSDLRDGQDNYHDDLSNDSRQETIYTVDELKILIEIEDTPGIRVISGQIMLEKEKLKQWTSAHVELFQDNKLIAVTQTDHLGEFEMRIKEKGTSNMRIVAEDGNQIYIEALEL